VKDLPGASFAVRVRAAGLAPFETQDVGGGAVLQVRLKPGHAVEGRVLDAVANKPVAGVTVLARTRASRGVPEAHLPQALTDADGRFRLTDLAPGVVTVEARGAAWARATLEGVAVPPKAGKPVELVVRPGGRLAGRVVGPDGKPVEGAVVRLEPVGIERVRDVALRFRPERTDAKGAFAFDGVQAGDGYRLTVQKKGMSRGSAGPFAVKGGTVRDDLEIRLDASASLQVRLVDPEGKPVPALEVQAFAQSGTRGTPFGGAEVSEEQIASEGDGRFRVGGLSTGTHTIELIPDGFASVERKDVKLEAGKTVDLGTVQVRAGRTLRGRVADATGAPVAGATVRAFWMSDGKFSSRQARSGADGRFRLAGVGEGPIQNVLASAKGYSNETETGVTTDEDLELTLERAGSIVGRIVHAETGEPVSARVEARPEAKADTMGGMRFAFGFEEDVYADADGSFRVESLEPGKYTVVATAQGKAPARKAGVEVRSEDVADVGTLPISDGLELRGRVLDVKDESPVAGAVVTVDEPRAFGRMPFGEAAARTALSDALGGFEVGGLEAKAYEVGVSHPDYARADARAQVGESTPEVVVRLSRGGILTGAVRDAQAVPVPGATVMVMQGMGGNLQSTTTGDDGVYRLERLAPGSYRAMRAPEGNRIMIGPGMKTAEIREGEVTVLDFDDASRITLTGRVLRGDRPVGGAMLVFLPGDSFDAPPTEMKTAHAEGDGRFQVGLDRPGLYTVVVQGGGDFMGRGTAKVQVPDQPQVVQDVVLSSGGIAGTVTGPDGKGIVSAVVQATPDPPPAPGRLGGSGAQTRAGGEYAIEGLDPGSYKVRAMAPGHRPAEATATVTSEGGTVRVDLRLETGRALRGRVVDPQGNGIQGAYVMAAPAGAGDSGAGMSGMTDANGAFEIIAPAEGPLDVTAVPGGYAPARATGVLPSDDPEGPGLLLRATPGGRLRVQVAGADGKPRAGVQVMLRPDPPYLGSMMAAFSRAPRPTDAAGTTVADMLAPGAYVVSVADRKDAGSATVQVGEGAEASATLMLP
jgi:uncharacterized GH25 family protein